MNSPTDRCPRCHEGRMHSWQELSEEEREVARRLPASADYTEDERRRHRFCTRCWHEAPATEERA